MKNNMLRLVILFMLVLMGRVFCCNAATDSDAVISIDEANFPDESFREYIQREFDLNHDKAFSQSELDQVKSMSLNINKEKSFSVQGIHYFSKLKKVWIFNYECMEGDLKKNTNLEEIVVTVGENEKERGGYFNTDKINQSFLISNIKSFTILCKTKIRSISFAKAKKLRKLEIYGDQKQKIKINSIDVKKNKNLVEFTLHEINCKKVDLQNNKKLKKVSIATGKEKWVDPDGVIAYNYYDAIPDQNIELRLPKKNKIKEILYFTSNRKLDLSKCRKLKKIMVSKYTKITLPRKWYRENAEKLYIQRDDSPIWSVRIPKRGEMIII